MEKNRNRINKPDCRLIGTNGNIFFLMNSAAKTLQRNGLENDAEEMQKRIKTEAKDYFQAIAIIGEYVNII